jgi:hypothetical protein
MDGVSIETKFMRARSFFDANVLVYADDDDAPAKQRRARDLVYEHRRNGTGVVSLQVLQEYFVTVTRKLKLNSQIARRKVEFLAEFDVAVPQVPDTSPQSTCTAYTHCLFGTPSSSALPTKPVAASCYRKSSNMAATSTASLS